MGIRQCIVTRSWRWRIIQWMSPIWRKNLICYHIVIKSCTASEIRIVHEPPKKNLSDILTKIRTGKSKKALIKKFLYWYFGAAPNLPSHGGGDNGLEKPPLDLIVKLSHGAGDDLYGLELNYYWIPERSHERAIMSVLSGIVIVHYDYI